MQSRALTFWRLRGRFVKEAVPELSGACAERGLGMRRQARIATVFGETV